MRSIADRGRNAVQPFDVTDGYVWAEICYLDLPTDFCEYLPEGVFRKAYFGATSP
jgi:hypothetical protein